MSFDITQLLVKARPSPSPSGMPYQAQAKAVIGLVSIPRFQPGVEVPVKIYPTDLSKVALVPQG